MAPVKHATATGSGIVKKLIAILTRPTCSTRQNTFVYLLVKPLLQLTNRKRLNAEPLQRRFGDVPRAAGGAELFAGNEVAAPVLEIECLDDARGAGCFAGEGGDEEEPVVGDRAVALQRFRLRLDVPAVVWRAVFRGILVSCCLHLNRHARLCFEIEGGVYLARRRQAIQDIANKILREDTDVGVLLGQIPKSPPVKRERFK